MRFSTGLIFGGLGLATILVAIFNASSPTGIQVISLSFWLAATTLSMMIVLAISAIRLKALQISARDLQAVRIIFWAGGFYIVLNSVFGLSIALAAYNGAEPFLSNDGLAVALLVWSFAHGGYNVAVGAISTLTGSSKAGVA